MSWSSLLEASEGEVGWEINLKVSRMRRAELGGRAKTSGDPKTATAGTSWLPKYISPSTNL
jgi:hypothetical protein